jgi:hypothetical protein
LEIETSILKENEFIQAFGINYAGTLPKIKKSSEQLQPIFEAFTNALEAIKIKNNEISESFIRINFNYTSRLFSRELVDADLSNISIEDSGIGFNDTEFERLANLNDTRKGFFNQGSGRVQFLHYFDRTEYDSIYEDINSSTGFRCRVFTLSKSHAFLKHNSIIKLEKLEDVVAERSGTRVLFKIPLFKKDLDFYRNLNPQEVKDRLIQHYLDYFCSNRTEIPKISIALILNGTTLQEVSLTGKDIPIPHKEKDFSIKHSKLSLDGKTVEKTNKVENFTLKAFQIPAEQLKRNGLKLTSKGEIAKEIKLDSFLPEDTINNNRYLFLLVSNYLNNIDSDTRGQLNIRTLEEFKKGVDDNLGILEETEIILDDIQEMANEIILNLYEEIKEKIKEKEKEVEDLKSMFLLNDESIKEAKIKLNDSEEKILEKVYQADAKVIAKKDAEIKKRIDALNHLNPASRDFEQKFNQEIEELTKAIPLQNRAVLTHYLARRKLVLELFDKILNRELQIQQGERKLDEKLLHNLLFQQGSEEPEKSDLWIINDDFIYFKGVSEQRLFDVEIDGKKLFKKEFEEEEERYLKSLNENRKIKRPDVLLFPEEGKCIIIEFKDPEVNVSVHLNQIDFYAYLIRNYTKDEFQITTFFGYFIGEGIEARDVRGRVSRYEQSYHFDYLFRPSEKVVGEPGRIDGTIYTEVLKYSTLVARAKNRNKIFLSKL